MFGYFRAQALTKFFLENFVIDKNELTNQLKHLQRRFIVRNYDKNSKNTLLSNILVVLVSL